MKNDVPCLLIPFVEAFCEDENSAHPPLLPLSLFYSTQISYGPGGQNDKRLLEDCVFN